MRAAAALLAAALLLAGCTSEDDAPPAPSPQAATTPTASGEAAAPGDPDQGYSTPVEDRVYPHVGDPGIDALHYDLHLTWSPRTRTLDAVETIRLRATVAADELRLDLASPLEV
ncbi:MAG TPA: hypothetical protein VD864_15160, partial [Nocardioides sp.]|nr:hypothetical protein [Nocardioides sp.]